MIIPAWQKISISPVYLLPLVLIFGVIDLVAVLVLASGSISRWNPHCEKEALGLPVGSVRALIALSLIVIFAIIVVFMQSQLISTPLRWGNGTYVTDTYGVVQYSQQPQALKDLTLQTLTTISTLVVAVAGFYFGSKSIESARKAVGSTSATKKLEITTNPSSLAFAVKGNPLFVTLENIDKTIDIDNLTAYGDPDGEFAKIDYNVFKYTPSTDAKKDVMLTFGATKAPNVEAKLTVKVSEAKQETNP